MNLLDFTGPDSHAHDPETSREAIAQHTATGSRARCAAIVLALVRTNPGKTACELWLLASESDQAALREKQRVRQRLVDLERAGLVRKGPPRRCDEAGTTQRTWYAIGASE